MRVARLLTAFVLFGAGGIAVVMPADVAAADLSVASVSAGGSHTCAVTTGGAAECWGWNSNGQLGDGTTTDRVAPVDVTGLGSGVATVTTGGYHTCARTTGGAVKCWGLAGTLGDGTHNESNTPVNVSGLGSGVAEIAAGSQHTCALTTAGAVKCWGDNTFGELGNGSTTEALAPVAVTGLGVGVAAISAGTGYTCALTDTGGAKCWGYNADGRLGDGTTTNRLAPVDVAGLDSGVAVLDAGENHTCAITTLGAAKCWGRNDHGQLGDATTDDAHTPVDIPGLGPGVVAVSAGLVHTCALTTDGAMHCWGDNGSGQLGDGTTSRQLAPVGVWGLDSGVAAIAAGYHHTCALMTGGSVKCWGDNSAGQLGDGTTIERDTPVDVPGLGAVAAITAGYDHTCALTTGGAVKCWGDNSDGQLGDGTTTERHTAVAVSGLGSGVVAVTAGVSHTCALTVGGAATCWGDNTLGQLGDGTATERHTAVAVSGLASGVTGINAGGSHTCALTTGGAAKCWGNGEALGNGTTSGSKIPVDVSGLESGVTAINGGGYFSCAVAAGGAVKCWGDNGNGQLGNGTTGFAVTAVDVTGLGSGATAVGAGGSHTCALTTGGGVKCWGWNGDGEVGDGSTLERAVPVDVAGLGSGVASITAEGDHSCAVTTAGTAECWGNNANGQLGDGPSGHSLVPVGVVGLGLGEATPSDPPSSVSDAVAQDGAANVSWAPPADDGGAPVYGYAITVIDADGGAPAGVTGPKVRTTVNTTFHFTGLSNGTSYRLDIAPLNRAGVGASTLSSIVRPHAPVVVPPPSHGYWMVGATGTVYAFGRMSSYGNAHAGGVRHIEPTPTRLGYWIVNAAGSVFAYGDAKRSPVTVKLVPGEYVSGLSSTPTGGGYWLFTNRGRVMSRGDARFFGDLHTKRLNAAIVGSAATPTGHGYYMVASDGGVFAFGDAKFRGSMGGAHLNKPVTGLVLTKNGSGYWLVASDGGIFAFNAPFRGSRGHAHLNKPIVGMVRYGDGYLMAASDGGVFNFSNLPFGGSLGTNSPPQPIVSVAASG